MTSIVDGDAVARFVSEKLNFGITPPYTAMGIERNGQVTAGVIFHCFEGPNVHVTVAGTGWTREFLTSLGDYVYRQLGCERMTLTTERTEVAALACRLGGVREGLLRNQFGKDRHGIIVGILRDEWRYGSKGATQRG